MSNIIFKTLLLKGEAGSIVSIEKTSTSVLEDTYTIVYNDGTITTFTVTNGKGIVSVEKTATSGLIDTYTITYNDNTTSTFTVKNGKEIEDVEKTATVGLENTYTITYNDDTTDTFTVDDGRGIVSITKTSTVGLTDTYTITYNDNTTSTFTVTNGRNGSEENIAPIESSTTASQAYEAGEHLLYEGLYYLVIDAISQGDTFIVGTNITRVLVGDEIEELKRQVNSVSTTINIYTPNQAFYGKTVTVTSENITYAATFDTNGYTSVDVYIIGDYTLECEGYQISLKVFAMGLNLNAYISDSMTTVTISTDSSMAGEVINVMLNNNIRLMLELDETGTCEYKEVETGTYTITNPYGLCGQDFQVTALNTSMSVTYKGTIKTQTIKEYKTFSTGTDAEIVAIVEAADVGLIDLYEDCGWRVNQDRTLHLSAMSATGVGESHAAQDIILVLSHRGGKTLTTPTASGRTTCSFQFDMKDCLNELGYMNSTRTNVGGYTSCDRRAWCNNVFKPSVPQTLAPIFKQFQNKTSAGGGSSTINTTDDWFALRSEIEAYGSLVNSYSGEGIQVEYYETSANKLKEANGTAVAWYFRSPYKSNSQFFDVMNELGSVGSGSNDNADQPHGIALFGVI